MRPAKPPGRPVEDAVAQGRTVAPGNHKPEAPCHHIALKLKRPTEEVGKAYFEVGRVLGFDWLRQTTQNLADDDHWEYLAANAIIEDLAEQQRDLTHSILEKGKNLNGLKAVESWVNTHPRTRRRTKRLINDIKTSGTITLAKLSFAGRHIRNILPRKL